MLGKKEKKIQESIGIHVGRRSLTIVRIAKPPGQIEIKQLFHTQMARPLSTWPHEIVAEALGKMKHDVNLKIERVNLTLPSDIAPNHFLMVPSVKDDQLDGVVKLQLANKWSAQEGELSYQFQVLEKRGDRYRMFTASIPLVRLKQILHSFGAVKLPIDLVEVESVSAANLVSYCRTVNATTAILNICPDWAEMTILRRDRVALSRPILKFEHDGAADTNPGTGSTVTTVATPKGEDPNNVLGAWYLDRVGREINKTLDYFEVELLCPRVERLLLIGEAASVAGLDKLLAQRLDIDVEVLDTGRKITDCTNNYDPTLHGLAVAAAAGEEGIQQE